MHHGHNWGICHQDSASTMLLEVKSILSTWDTLKQAISILASVMLLSSSTENSDKASNITCAAHRTPKRTPLFLSDCDGLEALFVFLQNQKPIKSKASMAYKDMFLVQKFCQ